MKPRLGCFTLSGIVCVILSVLIFGGVTLVRGGILFSPGSLNAQKSDQPLGGVRSHADLATKCAACHPAPWQLATMSDRCIVCHIDVLADPKNFHRIISTSANNCRDCHTDHHGPAQSLTSMDMSKFPHDKVGYSLKGHAKTANGSAFACADCHGTKTSGFDIAVCATCHSQIDAAYMIKHIAAFGLSCLACHDGVDVYGKGKFDHNKVAYTLIGKHATVDCAGCHAGETTPKQLKATIQDCFSCHQKDDPHLRRMGQDCASCHTPVDWKQSTFDHSKLSFTLSGKHATVACQDCHLDANLKGTPQDCFTCHVKDDPHQGQLGITCAVCHTPDDWKQVTFDHSTAPFKLLGKHATVSCSDCHKDNLFKDTPQDCYSCHAKDDKHQGQLGTDCGACHTPDGWLPATFDHSKAVFPLSGKHATVDCTACHVNGQFKGTPTDCYSCHAKDDHHQGQFGTDCGACHTPGGWLPATFDHSKSPFPLTGAHVTLACTACHPNGRFQGTPTACSGCHPDPAYHAGLFGTLCDQCHSTSGWIPAKFNGPHSFPTSHGGSNSCQNCHPNSLASYTCTNCHNGGEFRSSHSGIKNLSNCIACHPNGQSGGGLAALSQQYVSLFSWLDKIWGGQW